MAKNLATECRAHEHKAHPIRRREGHMLAAVLLLGCTLHACAAGQLLLRHKPRTAEEHYQQALEDLDSSLYPEAMAAFNDLKSKFPYSAYAPLGELGIADTQFQRGEYLDAADQYRNFLKYYPKHDKSPYAMHQIGEAFFKQIPEDWWFSPPAAEKDQANTRLAIASYRDAIARFPDAEIIKESRAKLNECRAKLAEHEMYVARFYKQHGKYKATWRRAEAVLKDYAGLGFDAEALFLAASARLMAGDTAEGQKHKATLMERFPNSNYVAELDKTLLLLTHTTPKHTEATSISAPDSAPHETKSVDG